MWKLFCANIIIIVLLIRPEALSKDGDSDAAWKRALPGWQYEFPRDHFSHGDFKTEWWYFTGNLETSEGREFGYQLTFFRQGLRPPGHREPVTSRFIVDHFYFGHLAVTDIDEEVFLFDQKMSRGAFGEAGSAPTDGVGREISQRTRLAWIDDWELHLEKDGSFRCKAAMKGAALDFHLVPAKKLVLNGKEGVSQKSAQPGNASHYYSHTRLKTSGTLSIGDPEGGEKTSFKLTGTSWFDREWGTSQLGKEQIGWDWFSIHLDDGSDLMLYQLREKSGKASAFSSGTFVDASGKSRSLVKSDFLLTPGETWKSPESGGVYPLEWELDVKGIGTFRVRAAIKDQELRLDPVTYWEGVILVDGKDGRKGRGYLEMTGYAGEVRGMQ